jgi:putative redox protein
MKIKQKPIWRFRVAGSAQSATRSVVKARDVEITIDEPIDRGGTNLGPMPVEMVMAGLAGCTHVISNKLANHYGAQITAMEVDVVTTMDSRGTRLIEPIDIPFPKVVINIKADMDGPRDAINAVICNLRNHCAVSKMLQQSGTEIVENWTVNGIAWEAAKR